jgi:membrane fusion protein (multidrug efflux system)
MPRTSFIGPRAIIVCVCALFWVCCADRVQNKENPNAEQPISVQVEVAAVEELEELRELSGDVHPFEVLPLSFKVGGRIHRIFVDEGDEVKNGELVALLDPRDYELARDLAESQVSALKPNLVRAEILLSKEAMSKAQFDELKSKMDAAMIQKSQAEAQLSYARLAAPMPGVVIQKMAAVGDLVGPSRPVAVLAVMKKVKVVLPVTQGDLPIFKEGLELKLDAQGLKESFVGKVYQIGYAADGMTRTFPIALEVDNPDLKLRAGMVVETRVPVKRRSGIFVPLDAIASDPGGKPFVHVVGSNGNRAEKRCISIGALIGDRAEVLQGLKSGDRVIVRGMVQTGNPVTVADNQNDAASEKPR